MHDMEAALKKRPPNEGRLAGAVRALYPCSAAIREASAEALSFLAKRSGFDRELYAAVARASAEGGDKRASAALATALATEEAGGLSTLSAACFSKAAALAGPLGRAALSRHAQVAFGAEVARAARGEGTGQRLGSIAPMIKESYRIALCVEVFLPLTRAGALTPEAAPAIGVLRDAERHLGRWLVLGEVATRAGDGAPLAEALRRSKDGPSSARSAWALVAWALEPQKGPPSARPTVEVVARLSERPSADRDMSFLFRIAATGAASARAMLESLAKAPTLETDVALRSARCLARHYGRDDLRPLILAAAKDNPSEELRALAAASLWDVGERDAARVVRDQLAGVTSPSALVWVALLHRAEVHPDEPVVDELRFRRAQRGWVE